MYLAVKGLFAPGAGLLHEMAQHGVDACLIASAQALEIREYVFVEPYRDRLFPPRHDQFGLAPIDIEQAFPFGVGPSCSLDLLFGHCIDAGPIRFTGKVLKLFARVAHDMRLFLCAAPDAPR